MTSKARNWLLAIFIVLFPFTLFCLFLFTGLADGPLLPLAPLPNPNGYDNFVKAGQMLVVNISNAGQTNKLQLFITANSNALQLARAGFSMQCRVRLQYTGSYVSNHIDDLSNLKLLAKVFEGEGELAETDNRPSDAAKSYLDAFHFGGESMRGGVVIDALVGTAIEAIAISRLTNLVTRLNADSCREIAANLKALDSQGQTWDEVMQQENAWSHRTFGTFPGWRYDIIQWKGYVNRWKDRKTIASVIETTKDNFNGQVQKTRQLIIALAARAYELEKGKPPTSAADLVPDYLKAVPQDPVTGTNMVYSPR